MNFLFSNAVLWPFAALIAVPILLHLFARAKPPVYAFSSLMFLRRVIREHRRVRKPRDWLLLALRTLLYAGLILAFLQPLWFGGRPAAAGAGRSVVLIVDATASMAARDGAQSHFAAACGEAADVLSGLTARDRANVIWLRATPQAVFPQPGVNVGFLRDSLRQGRVSAEAGDPAAALRLAADMLRDADGRREICIVSDFQRTTWLNLGSGVPQGIEVVTIPVARRAVPNLAITRLAARPAEPLAGEPLQVFVEVRNFSDAPRQTVVHIEAGELRSAQNLQVPAWGRATAVLAASPAQPGDLVAAAHIGEDDFADDNAAWLVIPIKPGLRAGLLAADEATGAYWRRALRALPWAQTVELPAEGWEAEAARCDALLLCGWDGARVDAVRAALEAGVTAVWYPARGASFNALAALTGTKTQGEFEWANPREPLTLRVAAPDDPAFALFAGGDRGNPAAGSFRGRLAMPDLPAGSKALLSYSDGTPALARVKTDHGALVLWNLSLAPEVSRWASRMEFLPLFGEILLTSRGEGLDSAHGALLTGQELVLRIERDFLPQSVRLEGPDSLTRSVTRRDEAGRPVYAGGHAGRPGLYAWRTGEEPIGQTAVNFPAEESDLRTIPPPEIVRSGWAAVSGGRAARERRDGVPVWPWCLGLALVCGLGESVVAWRATKT